MGDYLQPPVSGPGPVGQIGVIAAGNYTDIVAIIAPSEAAAGDLVSIEIRVKNIWTGSFYIAVTGRYNGVNISFSPDYAAVGAGATYSFTTSFTMPNNDIRLDVGSWYWTGDEWIQDAQDYVDIALEVEAPPVAGTITEKELDYQNKWQALPLYDIPVDTRTRVRIWGRNDTSINQKMGVYWFVADPEGYVVQEHRDWETFWTGPGLEQGFVGSEFDLSKIGKYTIWVELLMNPDDSQVVDRYIGDLCTVEAVVPESEFKGFSVSEYNRV